MKHQHLRQQLKTFLFEDRLRSFYSSHKRFYEISENFPKHTAQEHRNTFKGHQNFKNGELNDQGITAGSAKVQKVGNINKKEITIFILKSY